MPNYRRAHQPGGTFFLTLVTYDRAPLFRDPVARDLLHAVLDECRRIQSMSLPAFVLLPDHFHLLAELPPGDTDFSSRIARINAGVKAEDKDQFQ